jgi:release factor glutamine methyltransferase
MTQSDDHWTIGRLLQWTIEYLGRHGAENPRLDAEVLLAAARGCKRIDLYAAYGEEATEMVRNKFREMVRQRAAGKPVAYLVGHKEFYSLEFEVTPDVLIPRPETELLILALLDRVKEYGDGSPLSPNKFSTPAAESPSPQRPALSIADVGTGSGVLAVCAAKYLPTARITAIDISAAALAVARRNAEKHGVVDRIKFVESNLFAALSADVRFDFIVSNPPYISTSEMTELPPDVKNHEPHIALAAGEHGTDVIAPLVAQTTDRLRPGGALFIEISPMIVAPVEQLVHNQPTLELGKTIRDPAGHARVIQATKKLA